jgi:hypothetical protein
MVLISILMVDGPVFRRLTRLAGVAAGVTGLMPADGFFRSPLSYDRQ